MDYIIDGYNLIFSESSLTKIMEDNPEKARNILMEKLYVYREYGKHKMVVVFDGKIGVVSNQKSPAGIKVVYAKKGTADTHIRKLIKTTTDPQSVTVVSSDYKDIGGLAKACGCKYLSSQEFLHILHDFESKHKGDPEKPDNITDDEVEYWLRRFKSGD
ncbi:MAG: NYN domain-containing protein [candidate division Zixibacteria bacterium]|nr:NYN domain-containing protein [candidate division Zixibacteria bacterium]